MKRCPKCNELNGDNSTQCYKCQTIFPRVDNSYQKVCPHCGITYSSKYERCRECGSYLSVVTDTGKEIEKAMKSDSSNCLLYVLSFLLPIVGIILGIVYIAKNEEELGRTLLMIAAIPIVIGFCLTFLLASCAIWA